MVRSLLLLALLSGALQAAVWPGRFGPFERTSTRPLETDAADRAVWDEYGLEEAESAVYKATGRTFEASLWRLKDATGAFAAFEWLRPPQARESDLSTLAVTTPRGALVASGNYVLRFEGYKPPAGELEALFPSLPAYREAALPGVAQYMPASGLIPSSERYILGPASLQRFLPGLPVSAAGFQFSGEAQSARFRTPSGEVTLALFNYPTPEIARAQASEFGRVPDLSVKRSGPMVAAVLGARDAQVAANVLDQVSYSAKITLNERVPTRRDNVGDLIINVFQLTGILLVICLGGGLAVGGVRALSMRGGREPLTVLHLEDKRA